MKTPKNSSLFNLIRGLYKAHQSCFIGKNVRLGEGVIIRPLAVIDDGVVIGSNTFIGVGVVIRTGSIIGKRCSFGHYTVIEGGRIGDHVAIHAQCHISLGTIIKDYVFMGPYCITTNTKKICHARDFKSPIEGCVIGKACRIGANVTFTPGVTVGDETVIGAGSVVVKNIPGYVLAYGNPCKVEASVDEEETIFPKRRFHK